MKRTDSTEGVLNHIDELKRRLLRTLSVMHKGPLDSEMAMEVDHYVSNAVALLDVAEEILSRPPLPTRPGAVISNVKTCDGKTFTHAYLADPESDSVRWEAPGYARCGGWTAEWLADEDILSFKLAYEGIKEGKDD